MVLVVGDARGADEERGAQRRRLRHEHGHAAPHARSLDAGLKIGNLFTRGYKETSKFIVLLSVRANKPVSRGS